MPRTPWGLLRAVLRRHAAADADPLSDAELLARFVTSRDEAAFELLLRRHADLVYGVCRRVLADEHLAEDAFQATFLVLARKAAGVRGNLPGWLHRVARRAATRAARRRPRTEAAAPEPATADRPPDFDLKRVLDEEIDRLPERFRLPVVLCYLEDRSTDEAAKLLGVPRGTVLSRLATARATLSARLTRRGVTATGGLFAASATGSVSADVVANTVRQACGGAATVAVAALAREVMRMGTWKTIAAGVVLVAAAGAGTGVAVFAQNKPANNADAKGSATATSPLAAVPAVEDRTAKLRAAVAKLDARIEELSRTLEGNRATDEARFAREMRELEKAISSYAADEHQSFGPALREAERKLAEANATTVPEEHIAMAVSRNPAVRAAEQALREKRHEITKVVKESPNDAKMQAKLVQEELSLKAALKVEQDRVRPEVIEYLRVPAVATATKRVEYAQVNIEDNARRMRACEMKLEEVRRIHKTITSDAVRFRTAEEELFTLSELRKQARKQLLAAELGIELDPPQIKPADVKK